MKRVFAACTAALLALAACDHPNDPRVEATDGFGSNTLDVYTVFSDVGDGWSIANGELVGTGPATESNLLWNGVAFDNGWVEAESRRVDDGGLILKWIDNLNYYRLAIRDDSTRTGSAQNLVLVHRSGGGETTLGSKDVTWPRGTLHIVRFEAVGTKFIVYFDGVAQFEATEGAGALTAGRFGLRNNAANGSWANTYDTFRWHVPLR
ncbi:MAG TPA: hypothetical protein VJT67_11180 [Longimicrobiaceae bacterium]|nr:hypothetical protein [Longimicrobiaceae bacterium]